MSSEADAVRVAPRAGTALIFWHGHHPLSPLHEGAPLLPTSSGDASPKYVIRTDALFATPPPNECTDSWQSSSYVNALRFAQASSG